MSGFWSPGNRGPMGPPGGAIGEYNLVDNGSGAPPGSGNITDNAASLATATSVFISYFNRNGADMRPFINNLTIGSKLVIANDNGTGNFISTITGVIQHGSGATGYVEYIVDPTTTTFVPFPNNLVFVSTTLIGLAGQVGPWGPPGEEGPEGQIGPKGDTGGTGQAGPVGVSTIIETEGPEGQMGPPGLKGDTGQSGPAGPAVIIGEEGPEGQMGPPGVSGPQGPMGLMGPMGFDGDQGEMGMAIPGPAGPAPIPGQSVGVRVWNDAVQSYLTGVVSSQGFDIEFWDTDNMFDPSSPTKITIHTAGYYYVWANIAWEANPTGQRSMWFRVNGNNADRDGYIQLDATASGSTGITSFYEDYFNVGDYVELQCSQNSGGGLTTLTDITFAVPAFGARLITGPTAGPTGPVGNMGPPGLQGDQGDEGPAVPGPVGPTGAQGITGPLGPPALDGADGDEGMAIPGVPGPVGPIGPIGPLGSDGDEGPEGPAVPGPTGSRGPQGIDGPLGPPGIDGEEGPFGFPGPVGPQGVPGTPGPDIGCHIYNSSVQTIGNAVDQTIGFDSERYDTDNIHDTVTNNSRMTCNTAGKYYIWANIGFAANATGKRVVGILLNGITYLDYRTVMAITTASAVTYVGTFVEYLLSVGDYVDIIVRQESGGNLNTAQVGNVSPEAGMRLVQVGPKGDKGDVGLQGPPGMDGDEGPEGMAIPGPVGSTGAQGITGALGPPGIDGADGDEGMAIPGVPGATGASGTGGEPLFKYMRLF